MVLLILLAAVLVWAAAATALEVRRDGHRPVPTDWSRVADREPLHRAESGHTFR